MKMYRHRLHWALEHSNRKGVVRVEEVRSVALGPIRRPLLKAG